jgi:quercetin dioxygenase-like cupin family protein
VNVLGNGPAARADRAASEVLYDHADARIVGFHLQAGQRIAAHRSESTVAVHVTEGSGVFRGTDMEATLAAGDVVVFAPGEMHAIDAGATPLRFVAVIAPRPGG